MYTISAITNGVEYPIHNPRSNKLIVGDPWYEVGDNVNGSAEFTVYPDHPFRDRIHKLTTEIVIRNDGTEVFRGRVLYDDEDMSGAKKVVCEGELAYLCDSIQRPKVYHDTPVRAYLADLLANHNQQVEAAKRFQLGTVTVTDSNDSLYRYSNWNTTRECLSEKLVEKLGGHFVVRWENGIRYLDYLSDGSYYRPAGQSIEFGKNLLEYAKNVDATDIATCIIPLGAKPEEESSEEGAASSTDQNLDKRLTIESVNGGADYVSDENAVREYGRIFKTAVNDDVTTPSYLKTWGEEYLRSTQYEKLVLEVKAVDLSLQDARFERFTVRDQIHCISVPNGMDVWLPMSSMRFYLMRAEENTLTLGTSGALNTYTSANRTTASALEKSIEAIPPKSNIVQEALKKAKVLFDAQLAGGYAHYLDNELVISDNPVLENSQKMWRWGLGGLAYSDTGYNGQFRTAWTMDGAFVADFITAGTLQASLIKAGILSDEAGTNYWNMETGEFSLSSSTTVGGKTVAAIAEDAAEDAAGNLNESLDQSSIFNRLTNNGQNKGIYLTNGELYINASYLRTGILSDGVGKNYWNLETGEFRLSSNSTVGGKEIATTDDIITSVDIEYRLSDSATSLTGNYSWSTQAPTWIDGKYMWQRTATTVNDETTYSTPTCISGATGATGAPGAAGTSVSISSIKYAVGTSGTSAPTTGWQNSVPPVAQGSWLWCKITYSDNFSSTTCSYMGTDGEDGTSVAIQSATKSGKTTTIVLASSDGTTKTLSIVDGADGTNGTPGANGYVHVAWATSSNGSQGFSTSNSSGKTYIGVYSDNTLADSNNPGAYSWSRIKGDTGTGVSAVVEEYYLSTSSSTQSGGSWSESQPAWVSGRYIWTRTVVTWTDGSTTTTTPVLAKAINGANQAVNNLDSSLGQSGVFNRLTNNGQTQGIYLDGGKVYINGEYIKSRSISASQIKAYTITADEIAGNTITAAEIKGNSITANKLNINTLSAISADVGTLTAGVIQSSYYSSGVSGMKLDLTNGTADITGKVTATEGSIGGWSLTTSAIYRTSSAFGNASGMYFGTDGLSITDKFKVDSGGNLRLAGNIVLGYHGIATSSTQYPIFDLNADGTVYVGGRSSNSDTSATYLRGHTVRIYSHTSGAVYLGSSGDTAVTSDENLKDISEIDHRYEDFFMRLHPVRYRYKRIGHRAHLGYGAREVEAALNASGLTTEEFAGILIDRDVTICADEAQTEQDQHYDELYSLRYQEFGALYALMLQKAIQRLDALEAQIYQ